MTTTFAYWGIRGLGQPIRFLLAHVGVEHTEKQYANPEEWFGKDKPALKSEFANLPYLIDGDVVVTESSAIPFYIAKKHNRPDLLGQNADGSYSEAEVRVQQVMGVLKDIMKNFFPILFNPEFENLKEKTFTDSVGPLLNKIVAYLGEKEFLVGKVTIADFMFYELLSYFVHIYPTSITPALTAYMTRFENLSGVKEYLAKPSVNLKVFMPPGRATWSGPQ